MYTVLNFANLNQSEIGAVAALIGGSNVEALTVVWPEAGEPDLSLAEVDWSRLDTVIVRWGEPRVEAMLRMVRQYCLFPRGFHIGLVFGRMLWSCSYVNRGPDDGICLPVEPLTWAGTVPVEVLPQRNSRQAPILIEIVGGYVQLNQVGSLDHG